MSKSQAVRDYLANNPEATAREVKEALEKDGIEITPNLVYDLRAKEKRAGKQRLVKRKAVAPKQTRQLEPLANGNTFSADELLKAKELVAQFGDAERAKQAMALIESLSQ